MLTFLAIAEHLKPKWILWENVPGVLSSNGGRDFASFLKALGQLGYGFAYRVLDAQWCRTHGHPRAVPQRRRRVFVVGCLGDQRSAAKVLFESESLQRYSAKGKATRKGTAADVEEGVGSGGDGGVPSSRGEHLVFAEGGFAQYVEGESTGTLRAKGGTIGAGDGSIVVGAICAVMAKQVSNQIVDANQLVPCWWDGENTASTLTKSNASGAQRMPDKDNFGAVLQPVSFVKAKRAQSTTDNETWVEGVVAPTQNAFDVGDTRATTAILFENHPAVHLATMQVRRLTPKECERLQGFPDGWTAIPWKKKSADDCPDGPRYKALGNSMAVNCMEWIGERINAIETQS